MYTVVENIMVYSSLETISILDGIIRRNIIRQKKIRQNKIRQNQIERNQKRRNDFDET